MPGRARDREEPTQDRAHTEDGVEVADSVGSGAEHVDSAIHINQHDATLWICRLAPGTIVPVPAAPFVHVFVSRGAATLEGAGALETGDAVRLTDAGARALTATVDDTEVVIWEMASELAT